MSKHLFEDDKGQLHACESSVFQPARAGTSEIKLVWTVCEVDVPANKSFMSDEQVTCEHCLAKGGTK